MSAVMKWTVCAERGVNVSSHELCVQSLREVLMSAVMKWTVCAERGVVSGHELCVQREVSSAVMNCLQREALSAVKHITAKDSWPMGPVCQYNTYQVTPKEASDAWHTRDKFTRSIRNDKTPDAEKNTTHADKLLHLPWDPKCEPGHPDSQRRGCRRARGGRPGTMVFVDGQWGCAYTCQWWRWWHAQCGHHEQRQSWFWNNNNKIYKIKMFIKCKILSIDTILSTYTTKQQTIQQTPNMVRW